MRRIIFIAILLASTALSFLFLTQSNVSSPSQETPRDTVLPRIDTLKSLAKIKKRENRTKNDPKDSLPSSSEDSIHMKPTSINKKAEEDSVKEEIPQWPVKTPPILSGSLLPSHRIIAFYGNLYSKRMGILGEYHPDTVLSKLQKRVNQWQKADSSKKAIPALELIAISGQATPGPDSLYRMRMPSWMLDSVINMADTIGAIVILDLQVGKSTVEKEVPYYEKYLKLPNVHLAIDPEFYMQRGNVPGTRIGSIDAKDINYCVQYLAKVVKKYDLPPKLLVIHRFTQGMVTHYKKIKLKSQVQIIMDMDGFGAQVLKKDAYRRFIYKEPIEYTGIKLFLKNDNANGHKILSPKEVLKLTPPPLYVQYQ